ncbi:MAG: hypothetical protein L3J11_07150 [Draconibacterium sp.]|nr:hypothetical protein [Draconibacterium sp.]
MNNLIEYIPILTTLFPVYFVRDIYGHYQSRKTKYLLPELAVHLQEWDM